MKNVFLFLFLSVVSSAVFAQNNSYETDQELTGYWTGALIRSGNSVQILEAEIYEEEGTTKVASSIPDWAYYPPRISKIAVSGDSLIFETYYGEAVVLLDSTYMEMVGTIPGKTPVINIHLKKSLKPPKNEIASSEIEISNEGANISGTLYYPKNSTIDKLPCAVIVHGRGCAPRRYKASRAKKLAEYGMAAFVYDKRGSDPSGFPCGESTHDLNVSDVSTIVKKLSKDKRIDDSKIGLISYSAGGWIIPDVASTSTVPIAFMVTIVGPPTSVKEQQMDGMEAFMVKEGMDESAIRDAQRYIELLFVEENLDETYNELQSLLEKGDDSGWSQWLVEDDYVESPDDFDKLWVQRFAYDPAEDLKNYEGPYLAVFGENDDIVPYKKQLDRLYQIMDEADKTNYEVKVIAAAGHGMEHGSDLKIIGSDSYYYKFDRVAFGAIQYIIDFLSENEIIEK
ncbi:alpha/beta hydrolase family protein [Halocola ammonii]